MDLPGQAMEAEEIIKQLDMEQVEEMPMGTATSAPVQCVPIYPSAMSPYHSHTEDEEEDVVTHVDLPPRTGTQLNVLQELQLSVCPSIPFIVCLSVHPVYCLWLSLFLYILFSVSPIFLSASVHLFLSVLLFLSVHLDFCLSLHLFISQSVCSSLY